MAETWLTYRGAAARVNRSTRSIKRWHRFGMPMGWDEQGRRIVREEVLLAEFRKRLASDPAHRWRMRSSARDTPDWPAS